MTTQSASTKPYSDQGEVERMAYGYELMYRTICNIAGTSGASESWYRRQANEMLGRLSPLHSLTIDSNQHKPGDCLTQYKRFAALRGLARDAYEGAGGWKDGRFGQACDLIIEAMKERGVTEFYGHPLLTAIELADQDCEPETGA